MTLVCTGAFLRVDGFTTQLLLIETVAVKNSGLTSKKSPKAL
jgi:hypothetical protein